MPDRPFFVRTPSTSVPMATRIFEGKLAIVTGASRGIGAAICENLASKGANIVLNYTSDSSADITKELAENLEAEHSITTGCVQADLGSENGPKHIIEFAKNHFSHPKTGKFQIDILINNAGVSVNRPLEKVDAADFANQYNINVRGPLFLVQAALPYLPQDRSGRIVNLSSVSSSNGNVEQSVYGGTKAALESMTRTWARELSERATVNAVNPGPVVTDMWAKTTADFKKTLRPPMMLTPLATVREGIDSEELLKDAEIAGGRPAYAHEVAGVVAMCCAPDMGWCTGSVICANGGMKFSY